MYFSKNTSTRRYSFWFPAKIVNRHRVQVLCWFITFGKVTKYEVKRNTATIKHTLVWNIPFFSHKFFGRWNRKSKHIHRKSSGMALTDLDGQWLHLTVECIWCAGHNSVTPQIAGGQTSGASKQCSAYWALSDFPWPIFWASLMTSGGPRRAGTSDGATQSTGSCWLQGPKENTQTSVQASL